MCLLSAALLAGTFLRAKIRLLQISFIPAAVVGGVLLLVAGPQILDLTGKAGIPDDWYSYYSMLPGILIVPIVAGVPLGLRTRKGQTGADPGFMKNTFPLFFISLGVGMLQFAVGYAVHLLFNGRYDLYDQFGIELGVGFVGGHATAGTLGGTLREMNLPFWEISQGVATTTATIGLVGGIFFGILLINLAARKGQTVVLDRPAAIRPGLKRGFETEESEQKSIGRETTYSTSIDSIAFHTALILSACGCAYLCQEAAISTNIPVFRDISVWSYAMICMAVIWWFMCRLHADYLVDPSVKFVLTIIWLALLCRKCLKGYWFEQMIAVFGMCSGVFITGALLLRICDPELKTPVLASYSVSYTMMSICYFALLNLFISLPVGGRSLTAAFAGIQLRPGMR